MTITTTPRHTNPHANDPIIVTDEISTLSAEQDDLVIVALHNDGGQAVIDEPYLSTLGQGDSAWWGVVAVALGWADDGEWIEDRRAIREYWAEERDFGQVNHCATSIRFDSQEY